MTLDYDLDGNGAIGFSDFVIFDAGLREKYRIFKLTMCRDMESEGVRSRPIDRMCAIVIRDAAKCRSTRDFPRIKKVLMTR